jgi:hypothetical protein
MDGREAPVAKAVQEQELRFICVASSVNHWKVDEDILRFRRCAGHQTDTPLGLHLSGCVCGRFPIAGELR